MSLKEILGKLALIPKSTESVSSESGDSTFEDSDSDYYSDSETRQALPPPPPVKREYTDSCTFVFHYGPNKGNVCNKETKNGKWYCSEHIPIIAEQQEHFGHFCRWFEVDPLLELEVISEEIKQRLYLFFMIKVKRMCYILLNPEELEYVCSSHTQTEPKEAYTRYDRNKWRKEYYNKYNFLQYPSDILLEWNVYKKYRLATKELRKVRGIEDNLTYLVFDRSRK